MQHILKTVVLVLLCDGLATACKKDSNNSSNDSAQPAAPAGEDEEKASGSPGSGNIAISLEPKDGAPPESIINANLVVENHPEFSGTTDENGHGNINYLPPGVVSILVTSTDPGAALTTAGAKYGLKLSDILVKPDEATDLGAVQLKETGSLSGSVQFFDNPNKLDLTGSDVFIPGTSFLAKTDAAGKFKIDGIPEGNYALRMQHTGFAVSDLTDVKIMESQNTDIGDQFLSLSKGPEGSITAAADLTATILGDAKTIVTTRAVKLTLKYDSDAALMKLSDEPSFLNKSWIPVSSSTTWTFESDGIKNLYVMYADLNGLQSSPYSTEIIIDTENPMMDSVSILDGALEAATTVSFVQFTTSDSGSGIAEVMLSNVSESFNNGEAWQPYSPRIDWTLPAATGAVTVYAKVKDFAGRESNVTFDAINRSTKTRLLGGEFDKNYVLEAKYGPYLLSDNLTIHGDVSLAPGTTFYFDNYVTLNVIGTLDLRGTIEKPITITSNYSSSFDCVTSSFSSLLKNHESTPDKSQKTVIRHTNFLSIGELRLDGGLVENSTFSGDRCSIGGSGSIIKDGIQNLTIQNNLFSKFGTVLNVWDGDGNSKLLNNTGEAENFISQGIGSTNTVSKGNVFTAIGSSSIAYQIYSGTFDPKQSTVSDFKTFMFYQSNQPATYDGLNISNCDVAFNHQGTQMTITNTTFTNCDQVFVKRGSGSLSLSNSTITNAKQALFYSTANPGGYYGTSTFDHNNIVVTQHLAATVSDADEYGGVGGQVTFTYNNITCATGSNYCDLYRSNMNWGDNTENLTMNNNNISCSLAGNCRGFVFSDHYGGQAVTRTMNLDIRDNYWTGKTLNADVLANAVFDTYGNRDTTTDADIKIFFFEAAPALGVWDFTVPAYTTLGSPVATAGAP